MKSRTFYCLWLRYPGMTGWAPTCQMDGWGGGRHPCRRSAAAASSTKSPAHLPHPPRRRGRGTMCAFRGETGARVPATAAERRGSSRPAICCRSRAGWGQGPEDAPWEPAGGAHSRRYHRRTVRRAAGSAGRPCCLAGYSPSCEVTSLRWGEWRRLACSWWNGGEAEADAASCSRLLVS